jgi:ankyrin repeat protein
MNSKKLKALLIVGYDIHISEDILKLYNTPGYRIIHTRDDLAVLKGKIDYNTRLDIHIHGDITNGVHHVGIAKNLSIPTSVFLKSLEGYSPNSPLQIHLWSCYGGTIDANALGKGTILFTYIPAKYESNAQLSEHALKTNLQTLLLRSNKPTSQLDYLIDNLHYNLLQTITISKRVNGEGRKLVIEPALLEVMAEPDKVLKEAIGKIIDFAKTINYPNFNTKKPVRKVFSEKEKNELRVGYFIHSCDIGNIEAIKKLLKASSLDDSKALVNQELFDDTPLIAASGAGRLKTVEILIEYGAINKARSDGATPLDLASQAGHIKVVKLLLENGHANNADNKGDNSLFLAAQNGHLEIIKLLLEHDIYVNKVGKNGATPLLAAVIGWHVEAVELLLKNGAYINQEAYDGTTPFSRAVQDGQFGTVSMFIEHGNYKRRDYVNEVKKNGAPLLCIAVQEGHTEIAALLLNNRAQVDEADNKGTTPLILAAIRGDIRVATLLLKKHGAKVDKADKLGVTPLTAALIGKHTKVIKLLLDNGAHIDQATHDGTTPFAVAVHVGDIETVKMFIEHGNYKHRDYINKARKNGRTPLSIAAEEGHTEIAALLLNNGAQVDKADHKGITPLTAAIIGKHTEVVKLLLDNGASPLLKIRDLTPLDIAKATNAMDIVKLIKAAIDTKPAHKTAPILYDHHDNEAVDSFGHEQELDDHTHNLSGAVASAKFDPSHDEL